MKVGFIGLGTMGNGMASNLQKAGYELVVHDIRRAAADRRVEHIGVFFAEAAVEFPHQDRRVGRQVEPGAAVLDPGEEAVWPERHLLDLRRSGQ